MAADQPRPECEALGDLLDALRTGEERVLWVTECHARLVNTKRVDRGVIIGVIAGCGLGCAAQFNRLALIIQRNVTWTTMDVVWIMLSVLVGGVAGVAIGRHLARRNGAREFWVVSDQHLTRLWVRGHRARASACRLEEIATIQRVSPADDASCLICWPSQRVDPASGSFAYPIAVIQHLPAAAGFERALRAAACLDVSGVSGGDAVAPDDTPERIRDELDADERVLWCDERARTGPRAVAAAACTISMLAAPPFGVAFALIARASVARGYATVFIVGCGLLLGATWLLVCWVCIRRLLPDFQHVACYAITDRRGLIVHARNRAIEKFELLPDELVAVEIAAAKQRASFPRTAGFVERLPGARSALDSPPPFGSVPSFGEPAMMPIARNTARFERAIALHTEAASPDAKEIANAD